MTLAIFYQVCLPSSPTRHDAMTSTPYCIFILKQLLSYQQFLPNNSSLLLVLTTKSCQNWKFWRSSSFLLVLHASSKRCFSKMLFLAFLFHIGVFRRSFSHKLKLELQLIGPYCIHDTSWSLRWKWFSPHSSNVFQRLSY